MKKVVLAFDGNRFPESAFQMAVWLHGLQPLLVTGVFIPQMSNTHLWSYSSAMAGAPFIPLAEREEPDHLQENMNRFEMLCQQQQLPYTLHKDFYNFALPELKKETRFADLLLLSSDMFYKKGGDSDGQQLKEILHAAECPVMVVPETYMIPQRLCIAYDGSSAAVFAVKQFAYLFPQICSLPAQLIYIDPEEVAIPDKMYIDEWVHQHFPNITMQKISNRPKEFFNSWFAENKHTLLISGSFSRSLFSQFLRKSFVTETLTQHTSPLFIAHK